MIILNNHEDLRFSRTHDMIKNAFFELMDSVGFEKITVMNLTKKAMISRTTFYLHYKDKYDLLEQLENEILDGIKSIAVDFPLDELAKNGLVEGKPIDQLRKVYEYVYENKQFFKLMMCNNRDTSFLYKLSESLRLTFPLTLNSDRLTIPKHYALSLVVGVQTSIISEWIKSGMKETPEEMTSMIAKVMHDVPKNIFE
ncbi:TetR/AcrR family transcriptional regulator [Intestinibacter sp.]